MHGTVNIKYKIFIKVSPVKFHGNSSSDSRAYMCGQTDGRTDMTNVIYTFQNVTCNVHFILTKIYQWNKRWETHYLFILIPATECVLYGVFNFKEKCSVDWLELYTALLIFQNYPFDPKFDFSFRSLKYMGKGKGLPYPAKQALRGVSDKAQTVLIFSARSRWVVNPPPRPL